MLNNFFIFNKLYIPSLFVFVAIVFLLPSAANSQQCEVYYEMVTKLHHPDPGSYTVWDTLYGGGLHDEVFKSVLNKDGGGIVVGEETGAHGLLPSISMIFVHFDRRGRKVWDKHHNIVGLDNIVKMLPVDNGGYIVLANIHKIDGKAGSHASLWLGFFDENVNLKSQKIIKDSKFDLFANDIIPQIDKNGWIVSATVERQYGSNKNKIMRKNAAIYLLDKNGNEQDSRAYILGVNNEINGLSVAKFDGNKDGYIATGYFESPAGNNIGWVLRLNDDMSYAWQKEFSRGQSAKINVSIGYHDKYMLIFGDVVAANSGLVGSWLALLDGNSGKVLWQRYYYGETGHHDYSSTGIYANGDGLITLMMAAHSTQASPQDDTGEVVYSNAFADVIIPEYMDYAHVLTLSPRGVTMSGDAYYYGRGAAMAQIIEGDDGSRIMAGYSIVTSEKKSHEKIYSKDKPELLKEPWEVNLPNVDLSDKAKEGLILLKNKIDSDAHNFDGDNHIEELANSKKQGAVFTKNGWVVIGDMPDKYKDPCVRYHGKH